MASIGVVVAGAGLAGPRPSAEAACTGTCASNQLNLPAGSLSIAGMVPGTTLNAGSLGSGSVSGSVDSATWADTTGSGSGWHGSIASTYFVAQGNWVQTAGTTTALGASAASGGYTGSAGNATITVTVASGATVLNTPFSWTDTEGTGATPLSGSVGTCANGSACAVGSNGITITFATASLFPTGATYTAKVGVLKSTALTLDTAAASSVTPVGTTAGSSNLPTYENNASTVTATSPTTPGTAVNFVTAAAGAGAGQFTLAPGVTISWDPNNVWASSAAANYVATVQFTIASGP